MLNGNVHSLVEDIETLLEDICAFLSDNMNDGFSEKQRLLAEKLINRSKSQLQTINKLTETIAEPDTSYVDMTPKAPTSTKEETKEVEADQEYSAIDEQQISRNCPYTSKSASDVKENNQWGYLDRKKSLWFLGHQIRQFGVVIDGWFLLYNSERDPKPVEFLDLDMYTVKYCDPTKETKCKKESRAFELVCSAKSYQFTVKNSKDMDQWVTAITKTSRMLQEHENIVEENVEFRQPNKPKILIKELPPLPQTLSVPNPYIMRRPFSDTTSEPLDTYDDVNAAEENDDEDGENIYECPVHIAKPPLPPSQKQEELPPPLPPPLHSNSFLHSLQRQNAQLPPQTIQDEDEEVEYDLPLNEKAQPPQVTACKPTNLNFSGMGTLKETMVDESEEEYDEVMAPPPKKPELNKPNIQQLINKANVKQAPPKIQPKPKFAGINRGGSFTKR